MRPIALAFVLALLCVQLPLAVGAEPVEVEMTPTHVGDKILYRTVTTERVWDETGADMTTNWGRLPWRGELMTLIDVEGPARGEDEYGVEREGVQYLITRLQDGQLVSRERCLGGDYADSVRWDYLAGGPIEAYEWKPLGTPNVPLVGDGTLYYNATPIVSFQGAHCDGWFGDIAGPIHEGQSAERYWILFRGMAALPRVTDAQPSKAARATEWNGRPALSLEFPIEGESHYSDGSIAARTNGTLRMTIADGFPGAVSYELHQYERSPDGSGNEEHATLDLVGYEPGTATAASPHFDLERRNPLTPFVTWSPDLVPDGALDLEYPFAVALAALQADTSIPLGAYIRSHPSAGLTRADYDSNSSSGGIWLSLPPKDLGAGPGWEMCFSDGASSSCALTMRPREAMGTLTVNRDYGDRDRNPGASEAFEIIAPASIADLAEKFGVPPGTIQSLSYQVSSEADTVGARIQISQVPWSSLATGHGKKLDILLHRGAVFDVKNISSEFVGSGLLSNIAAPQTLRPAHSPGPGWTGSDLTPFEKVVVTLGIAGTLGLVVKLLLPLYTRLRRDRLLDNPVRARLYDRIRSEPGIHLAELQEFLGVGKGATKHHVDQLVNHKLVFVLEDAGYLRAYASGHIPVDVARKMAVLRAGSHARVFELYTARPSTSLREAAAELRMSAPSVYRAKKRLQGAGLLTTALGPDARKG